ncbi:MAG: hypothetical protein Crog4KO_14060 [Crocinitomicaceae bacterium]
MMRFAFISVLIMLAACGPQEEKVVDLSKRIPTSKRNYDDRDTVQNENPFAQDLEKFKSWNPKVTSIRPLERRSFLERFQPKKADKFIWYLEDGDSLEYERMVFPDSIRTSSALYNWLDHANISYFGASESIQKEPFALMITDTVMLRLSGAIDFKFWESHIEDQDWMDEGDHWIRQRKYGNAQWFVLKDDKLKDLTTDP